MLHLHLHVHGPVPEWGRSQAHDAARHSKWWCEGRDAFAFFVKKLLVPAYNWLVLDGDAPGSKVGGGGEAQRRGSCGLVCAPGGGFGALS